MLEHSLTVARELGHDAIGPEHVLIAICRHAPDALGEGRDPGDVEAAVVALVPPASHPPVGAPPAGEMPWAATGVRMLEAAWAAAARDGSDQLAPGHLLAGIPIPPDRAGGSR